MTNTELIQKFYTAFSNGDHKSMNACYHKDIVFKDPAFGKLKGIRAKKMWEMLLSNKDAKSIINFKDVEANNDTGSANWTAEYNFGPKNRKVLNVVQANFKFKDGKIIEHIDTFSMWKWTRQALGLSGLVMGWTTFMKMRIQNMTKGRLDRFIGK